MSKVTAANLVHDIGTLPFNQQLNYIHEKTSGLFLISNIVFPEGPITIKRWNPAKGESISQASKSTISSDMIWRLANAFEEDQPINVDRVFGASYNTRSVLESLIAYTPQFYFCYPGRIQDIGGNTSVEHGHKHLVWHPSQPHKLGSLTEFKTNVAISEIPSKTVFYDSLAIEALPGQTPMDIALARRHSQIQVALYLIGHQLGYKVYIAANDSGMLYKNQPLISYPGVVKDLDDVPLIKVCDGAANAGRLIDVIWIGDKTISAVFEVEQSTGVTSGLDRMLSFQKLIPPLPTKYVIAAPDDYRSEVASKIHKSAVSSLNAKFFPYSSIEELLYLCQSRKLSGITDAFLECFLDVL